MADASKYVEHFTLIRSAITDTARRQQRQVQRTRNTNGRTVAMLLFAVKVALQLDVDIAGTEELYQLLYGLVCGVVTAASQCRSQWAFDSTRQTDNTLAVLFHVRNRRRAFGLCRLA